MSYLVSCLFQIVLELRAERRTPRYVRFQAGFAMKMGLERLQVLPTYSRMYDKWIGKLLEFQIVLTL